jgi:predicted pyridoxine 5'-phosphate oxidase superfamily flavin-nucleotide-binding protein
MSIIATVEQLEAIYGQPNEASTVKVSAKITPQYRALIDRSPFAALATCGPEGLDCSPRGDVSGFVRVHDEKTLMMPDRRGNNRVDSLRNIVRDPRVALLFLIPGSGSTLRVNGRAQISVDPDLLASFSVGGKAPRTVGHHHGGGRDLFSVRPRHRPVGPVESRQAGRPQNFADAGPDSCWHEREPCRRRGLRQGLAGTRAAIAMVTCRFGE